MSTLFKTKEKKFIVLSIALIVIQMIICIIVGYNKLNLFCDEVFTYGLSNCEDYTFLIKDTFEQFGHNGWVDTEFFEHYIDVDKETPMSFSAAYNNQAADVHPPLYYFLMHIMCVLFGGVYTKWSGLLLNLLILLGIDLALYKVGKIVFYNDRLKAILPVLLWSCSAVGLSNVVFIRMYLLLTLECVFFVLVHIGILNSIKSEEKTFNVKRIVLLSLVIMAGGLTHYYFYPFVFFFGASVSVVLLAKNKLKDVLIYISTMLIAFGVNLLIFPATIDHVFNRARGTEVLSNLTGRSGDIYPQYLNMINESMFGGLLWPLIIICCLIGIFCLVKKGRDNNQKLDKDSDSSNQDKGLVKLINNAGLANTILVIICIATYGLLIIAIQGSQLIANRYIWQAYPFLAIIAVKAISTVLSGLIKNKMILSGIMSLVIIMFCVLSICRHGIEYLYSDYDTEEEVLADLKGDDRLIYNKDTWIDIYTTFFTGMDFDEAFLIKPEELENIEEILDNRRTKDKLTVWVPTLVTEEDTVAFINKVVEQTAFSQCVLRGNIQNMQVYELK